MKNFIQAKIMFYLKPINIHAYYYACSEHDLNKERLMSESMNIEKKDNLVAVALFTCIMLLKVCTLIALFSVYREHHATPQKTQNDIMMGYLLKK